MTDQRPPNDAATTQAWRQAGAQSDRTAAAQRLYVDRRTVLRTLIAAAIAPALSDAAPARAAATIRPNRLRAGQRIGLVAPASPAPEDADVQLAADIVGSLGFEPVLGEHVFDRDNYLAGSDRARAADINRMFADPTIDAIFCLRGGYGSLRLLPLVDYDSIAANPKIIIGFSDITALLNAIHTRTGLIVFHGPLAQQTLSDYTLAEYEKVLEKPSAPVRIGAPPPFETRRGLVDRDNRLAAIVGGRASGRLVGGNLTLTSTLLGTRFQPEFEGRLLFLEDIDEAPYRIDRMLTQLALAGVLESVAGIVLGKFTNAAAGGNTFSLEHVFRDRLGGLGKPVLRGLMIGHVGDQTTVPIGARAELDADEGSLTLLEAAVR